MTWKSNKINVAIQVLPEAKDKDKYALVDEAIAAIEKSGFRYQVCPFETVVECTFEELPVLMTSIHNACGDAGTEKMLMYLKIQVNFANDVTIEQKMDKYK